MEPALDENTKLDEIEQLELTSEEKLEKAMNDLRHELQMGARLSFFHHELHPDLLHTMHGVHETLFKIHLAILKKENIHFLYLAKEINLHKDRLKQFSLTLENNKANLILEEIIKLSENITYYLELLYDNQKEFEVELVDKEIDLLCQEEKQKREPLPVPTLQYKRYYLYPHPDVQ